MAKPATRRNGARAAGTRPSSKDAKLLDALRRYMRAKGSQFLNDPNVTSVGIGYKQVAGSETPELAIQFTVDAKVAPEAIGGLGSTPIPESVEVDGIRVPTDVVQRSYKPAFTRIELEAKDPRKVRAERVVPGMSVGNTVTSAGTVGAFVRDRQSGKLVLLSNWHVLHGPGGQIGIDVVQPGRHDDNRVALNRIGQLLRSHLGPAGDCAIASIGGRAFSNEVFDLGVTVSGLGDPAIGDLVVKSGRTTGVTRGKVTRIEVNTRMDYGGGVTATIGGFEIGLDEEALPDDGEISRGGDSGSAWLALDAKKRPTDVMLGLHFAGDADGTQAEFALACYASSVMTALEVEPAGAAAPEALASTEGTAPRSGFDRQFLGFAVAAPGFVASRAADLATLEGEQEIRYCHFSVWLSRGRKYPLCVAWNIDGNGFKRLNRGSFRVDRRGDLPKFQLGDAIYARNPLHKGQIARRADLCWGSAEEARQGHHDSACYTNIVPQHEAFNQAGNRSDDPEGGAWGRLENTLLDTNAPHRLRISLMGGPVFGPGDRKFVQDGEECILPDEFWKVIAFTDDQSRGEKAYAFLLTQRHLVALSVPQGPDLEPWLWARIGLRDLEAKTGLRFPAALHERESPFVAAQSVEGERPIRLLLSPEDYFA